MATWLFTLMIVLGKWKIIRFSTIIFVYVIQPFRYELGVPYIGWVGVLGSGLLKCGQLIPCTVQMLAMSPDL